MADVTFVEIDAADRVLDPPDSVRAVLCAQQAIAQLIQQPPDMLAVRGPKFALGSHRQSGARKTSARHCLVAEINA